MTHVLVMAKAPIPGRVKTRLCPPCTAEEAAVLAEAALADTLAAALGSSADEVVVALDGPACDGLPHGVTVIPQAGRTFAERLTHAWQEVGGPGLQIGMDTPQITADDIDRGVVALTDPDVDAALGLAHDGGWWAIGFRQPHPHAFRGIPMSQPDTGARQRIRLHELNLDTALLPVHRDVDNVVDAVAVAAIAPSTRFAEVVDRLGLAARLDDDHVWLRAVDGRLLPFDGPRYRSAATAGECAVLQELDGPVLDVGCGPGRHVTALSQLGTPALGVDPSIEALAGAWDRDAAVLLRSIFAPLPGEGRWPTALVLDGNVGIGGDPGALLRRLRELVRPDGTIVVETSPPGAGLESTTVRLERRGATGPWFPWAIVGAERIGDVAAAASLEVRGVETVEGRWFARLSR